VVVLMLIFTLVASVLPVAPLASAVLAQTINESGSNNTAATAQLLERIGRESPLGGQIDPAGDVDWYRFEAVEGRTYVVELFNVATTLGGFGPACNGGSTGLSLLIYGPALGTTPTAGQCGADNSAGNVHSSAQFKADTSGSFYIRILPSNAAQMGTYSLRILPRFGEPGASWDVETFEPNNWAANAYAMSVGRENVLRSTIEARSNNFSTFFSDVDWYRFEAVEGRTYVVELFNVATTLSGFGPACDGGSTGLSLLIYGPALGSTATAGSCGAANSAGDVHSSAEFKADTSGTYYIRLFPSNSAQSGTYSLRILPRFGEPEASWDATTFEPNNWAANAYAMSVGRENVLRSTIEARSNNFSTFFSDVDWYRFEAVEGRTYVVELFNVATTLSGFGPACDGGSTGLSLLIYGPALGSTATAGSCGAANSAGDVHSSAEFKADTSGTYYIRLFPSNSAQSGTYSLRILPRFGEPEASWENSIFEPNNRAINAYAISRGASNALQAAIEPRSENFSTFFSDVDWYRFEAVEGQTYVVELFNVATTLNAFGPACNGGATGLSMLIYSPALDTTPVAGSCGATERSGSVQTRARFQPTSSGIHYIRLFPNNSARSGAYSIRVCDGECQVTNRVYLPILRR
jgi:hypothetical protein